MLAELQALRAWALLGANFVERPVQQLARQSKRDQAVLGDGACA